jgi:hypothetical protein
MTDPRQPPDGDVPPLIPRSFGLPGAVMLSWMIAGGVLAGGFLVAYGTLGERISGHGLLYTAGGLYLFGSLIGAILGGALGMFGRPLEVAAKKAFHDQLIALLYAMPALFLAFVLTGWIAMTVVAITLGEVLPLVGVSLAYLVGFVAVGVAVRFGWFGAQRAWDRFGSGAGRRRSFRLTWVVVDDETPPGQVEGEPPVGSGPAA